MKEQVTYRKVQVSDEGFADIIDVMRLRVDVFIKEQGCPPGWDPDEVDKAPGTEHYVAVVDNQVVAAARLREEPPGSMKIENMVVAKDHRGRGIGTGLTHHLVSAAQRRMPKALIWMEAQAHDAAQKAYKKAGFVATDEPHELYNLGIPHVRMEYRGKRHPLK